MSEPKSDLREGLAELLRAGGSAGDLHLSPEGAAAFCEGTLPEDRAEAVREHVARCRECADLVLDYRDFAVEDPEAAAAWERQREAAWAAVRGESRPEPGPEAAGRELPHSSATGVWPGERTRRSAPLVRWLAAGLAAASLAAGGLGVFLWQARSELGRPNPARFVALEPEGSGGLRGPGDAAPAAVPAPPRGRIAVLLAYPDTGALPRYEVRIEPPAGAAPRVLELEPAPDGTLAFELGADPEPGVYRIVLYGMDGEERRELVRYIFRVTAPARTR